MFRPAFSPDKASRTCRLRFGLTFLHFGQIGAIPFTDEFEGSWDQGIHRLADLSSRMILIMSWNERWCFASSRTTPQRTSPDNASNGLALKNQFEHAYVAWIHQCSNAASAGNRLLPRHYRYPEVSFTDTSIKLNLFVPPGLLL